MSAANEPKCEQCALRANRKFVLQTSASGHICIASQAELIEYLQEVIEGGRKFRHLPGEGLGIKVRIDQLTREQAALMIFEIGKYNNIKTMSWPNNSENL